MNETEQKTTKICSHCGKEKPIEEFGIKRKNKDGRNNYCKECQRELAKQSKIRRKSEDRMLSLSQFTPRELMEELAKRGYKGKLEYTRVEVIDIQNF